MIKVKSNNKLLTNVTFLYFIFFVTIINLFGFMYNKDYESVFLFACTAIIIYLFNNNMIIVLVGSLLFVNMLILLNKLNGKEGLENSESSEMNEENMKKEEMKEPNMTQEKFENKNKNEEDSDIYTSINNVLNKLDSAKNLKDDTKDSTKLNNKLKEIKKSDKICENSDNVYVLIHELNTKINELSQLIE